MLKKLREIDNKWFFKELPVWTRQVFHVFIRGDLLVLLPLFLIILTLALFSIKFMLIISGAYIAVRYFGEMIYWINTQFGDREYRPGDFGFKKLDNHAIYILYQAIAIAWIVLGIAIAAYAILYIK